jgi:hypothetical protein
MPRVFPLESSDAGHGIPPPASRKFDHAMLATQDIDGSRFEPFDPSD